MDQPTGEALLRDHLTRNPGLRRDAVHDAERAADLHRVRMVLVTLDESLTVEGLPDEARHRIGARLVTAWLGTDESHARLSSVRQLLDRDTVRVPPELL
ncbi:hypothetical protein [Streptomyces sp. CA-253872]|uniref:hypothetical protein n=1 Tax=Streptomyces sp. CA-253872 TaxID=3240067 RepID=UPI003D8FF33E